MHIRTSKDGLEVRGRTKTHVSLLSLPTSHIGEGHDPQ